MPTQKPPGPTPHAPEPHAPGASPADFELADDAFDLLDLGTASGSSETPTSRSPHAAPRTTGEVVPSELLAAAPQEPDAPKGGRSWLLRRGPRPGRRTWALGALACAAVLACVTGLMRGPWVAPSELPGSDGGSNNAARDRIAELLPRAPRAASEMILQPLDLTGAPEPRPLPQPSLATATWANVDGLDGPSLATVPRAPTQEASAYDLWAWAQCRRLLAMNDAEAKPALEQLLRSHAPLPQPSPVGHGRRRERARARHHRAQAQVWEDPRAQSMRPLQAAAYGAAALLVAPKDRARRTLELLRPLLIQTPQGQMVAALGDGLGRSVRGARAQHDQLTALVAQRPRMVDAKLALAKSHLDTGDLNAAMALLTPMAMDETPDTWARAAHLMWQAKQMTALSQVMARKLGGAANAHQADSGAWLARQLAQASEAHRTVMRRLVMRHLLEEGNLASALAWAMAQLAQAPNGAASAWDALRLAHLNHTDAPQDALQILVKDLNQTAVVALALGSGGWRLTEPSWQNAATALVSDLPPRSATPKIYRALMHERLGATSEAVSVLRSVALGRLEPQVVVTLARAQVASLRPSQPEDRLQALARLVVPKADLDSESLRPDIAEMDLRVLKAAQSARRPAQTQQAAQNLLWQDPLAQDPLETLGIWALSASEQHAKQGGDPKADPGLRRMEQLMAQRPRDDGLVERTLAMVQEVAPARTIGLYQTLLLRHPQDMLLTSRLVEAYVAQGDTDAAEALLAPLAAGHGPEAQDGNVLYAQALLLAATQPGQAHALIDTALQSAKPQARFYNLLATLALSRSLPDDALEALTRGCELAPKDVPLQLRRAQLLLGKRRVREADTILNTLLSGPMSQQQQAQAWLLRADCAREENDPGKAAQALTQALAASPPQKAAPIALTLAKVELQELGQGAQALQHLQELVAHAPDDAQAHYYLALALRDQNVPADAVKAFERYLELAPSGEFAVDAKDALHDLGH